MAMPRCNKDVRRILRALRTRHGIEHDFRGSGHIGLLKDGNLISVMPSSPSDHRALKNKVAELRRMGYDL